MLKRMNKIIPFLSLLIIGVILTLGNFAPTMAQAAAKPSMSASELSIPIGKINGKTYWNTTSIWDFEKGHYLKVKNKVKEATYSFTSSNSKVVTINEEGGYPTGIKAGKATITCTQTYKNKKTVVGKCSVTVNEAKLVTAYKKSDKFFTGVGYFGLVEHYDKEIKPVFYIAYRNPKATYTFTTSNSESMGIVEVKQDASNATSFFYTNNYKKRLKDHIGDKYFYGNIYSAKKPGNYKITVEETYHKKTITVGTFKMNFIETHIAKPNIEMMVDDMIEVNSLINYPKSTEYYDFEMQYGSSASIISTKEGNYLVANKPGTTVYNVYEGTLIRNLIGTITVDVKKDGAPSKGITLDTHDVTQY